MNTVAEHRDDARLKPKNLLLFLMAALRLGG
jgi:hypothetical protein